MSLAENLLNSLSTENISENYSTNEEEHIVIDNTRKITVPQKLKTIAVEKDKDIETVTFDCIRYWDGHDLCNFAIYINYVLPNLTTGTYTPSSVYVDANDSRVIHFDWNIKDYMTQVSGGIVFAVSAIKTDSEGNIEYRWSSLQNSDFFVAEGIDISEPPNNIETSTVLAQMSDILNQLQQETRQLNKVLSVTSSTDYIELNTANNTLTLPKGFRIFYSKEDGEIVSFELAESSVTLNLISPSDSNISLLLYNATTGYQIAKYWYLDEFDLASTYYVCTISAVSANGVVNIPQINIGVPYKVDGVIPGGSIERKDRISLPSLFAVAHRGYVEGAGATANETIADFQNAINHGYKFLEADVHVTADSDDSKRFILWHEDEIGNLTIATHTFEDLQAATSVDIATVDEFLIFCKKYDAVPVVEMKGGFGYYADRERATELVQKIEKYGLADRAFITSFGYVDLLKVSEINPYLNLVWWRDAGQIPSEWQFVNEIGKCKTPTNRVYIGYEVSTELDYSTTLDLIKTYGLTGIIAHTVDDEERLNEIIPYIAGFITNDILPFTATTTTAEVYDGSVTFE